MARENFTEEGYMRFFISNHTKKYILSTFRLVNSLVI